ncbi:BnaA02g05930D [Brassica napus]|uniref:BnaA02g05930D protein n=1 Tax=Brassica napus TaxID=3708 RepID=A0A078F7U2_BRANA|nr:unnamed protein product [Brassica napus]CDY09167.1 BnaA02g05930D [Brassica napus]
MKDSQVPLSPPPRSDLDHADNSTTDIPYDLIVEILSRLPVKPLLRFQSVSKLWFSAIRTKNFVDSFLTRSKTKPRLLLPFMHLDPTKLRPPLSAPEDNSKEDVDKSSSTVTLRHYMTISDLVYYTMSRPVNGLICCMRDSSIAVCNPATRQIVKLPDVTRNRRYIHAFLGYDPVEDQYKVLCVMMTKFDWSRPHDRPGSGPEHLVCTVTSSEKQEWRKIENTTIDIYRTVIGGGMCIAGAIYYEVRQSRIVRFDVRTETIKLIKAPEESNFSRTFPSSLLNYNGKLVGVEYDYKSVMRLWILEDAEKQEWSSMTSVLPSELKCLLGSHVVSKGDVHTGDLMVFYPWSWSWSWSSKPFRICYYDFKKESIIRKVEVVVDGDLRRIHGIGEKKCQFGCYPGYFENIRFL